MLARYWREEPIEVDAVIDGSWDKWAIEVKAGSFGRGDLGGLLEFTRRNPEFKPLVVCRARGLAVAHSAGVAATTWQDYLLRGTTAATSAR